MDKVNSPVRDPLGRAYNQTTLTGAKMMQHWADYLDEIKEDGKVISLHGQTA